MTELILCYVDLPWAYFTSNALENQWGDDWNDAPYEHNAGDPYTWHEYMAKNGIAPYEIVKVAFDDINLLTPKHGHLNSPFSVEAINAKAIPWLRHDDPRWTKHRVTIWAGATLEEFRQLIALTGGKVYEASLKVGNL